MRWNRRGFTLLRPGLLLWLALLMLGAFGLQAQETDDNASGGPHVAELTIDGPIGPATKDYILRSIGTAHEAGAHAVLIRMDTPGGLDAATRDMIKGILAAPLPVITYVHPAGARAASAGTYILYGSHVAAMTPSTSLGAATPVQMGGLPTPPSGEQESGNEGDEESEEASPEESSQPGSAMERKAINDSVAFIRGLAERYDRNADWAEKAVREALSLTASEALEQNVIDVLADNREDLLAQLDGREVKLESGPFTLQTAGLPIVNYAPDWRSELLGIITNPQIASILLLIGVYGLILEGYNPGAMVPGVVGIICLLLGLYALQVLPVNYAGLALIVLGGILILAEAFLPSFGVLGIGGVIALVMGSIMLVDTDVPGMEVSYEIVGAVAAVGSLAVLGIITMVGRSLRMPRKDVSHAMVGRVAEVTQVSEEHATVRIDGEFWTVSSDQPLKPGDTVEVVSQDGLHLTVRPTGQ
ncbi:nodulation protein NfeD [Marinimicrobium sp. C6131]|uniref:NfeD family protein n=1 Tax=Marinimicrobium sp. C6131 TaxID=3022676 RepID=UPI00223E747B|nr:nodulation protein NfeD [Marinimicrobium sp. C6131]UZJ43478.1 nodulation protein NfeD [Marinimicrobium sp. C6131]